MTTTNHQMTSEQLADLSTLAAQLQAKAEANDDRDTAVMAYAVQRACSELEESRREFRAADATIHNLEQQLAAVVAENAGLKAAKEIIRHLNANREEANFCGIDDCHIDDAVAAMITPATDAYLAEVRAQARNEGINYAASRLAAAYNHGFIGKSMSEVADVVHMILDAKADLANDPMPAADGLSGEYAEKSLVEFAAQLRQGAEHEHR
ncbi:TPA: DUF4752 domain-containing protein [Kluyvera georgiana]